MGSSNRGDPRRDAEFTLGLDDEWEDVPTAELNSAAYDEVTSDVEPSAAPLIAKEETIQPVAAPMPRAAPATRPEVAATTNAARAPGQPPKPIAKHAPAAKVTPQTPIAQTTAAPVAASATAPQAASATKVIAPRDITTGSLLCNRYLLGRLLGAGGSSLIFQAEDRRRIGAEDFGSRIAIKVLRPEMRHNAHALTRLKREFRQMQRLSHPGVAHVFELGCDEDIWFMTMELIEGQTINQWLKAGANRTDGLQLISACCEALTHAHAAGVVHGDLKPSNVLVLPSGGVKLVDFGSAAERDAATGLVDKERSFAATPPYASPQVLAGEVADTRDDVFSLACLTYAVLTNGEHPFDRKSSAEAQQAQLRPTYARAIHPRQFEVIVRGLAWDREQRPASVREFMHALLASDWRREPTAREALTDAVSRPVPATPAPEVTAAPAPLPTVNVESPVPTAAVAPQRETPANAAEQHSTVKPEDIARLKAAVAAAEAHAERIEKPQVEEPAKGGNPLDRFRGYVAGPMAQQADEEADEPVAAQFPTDTAASKKPKRIWPWLSSALIALAIGSTTALIASQFDAEPIAHAEARPVLAVPVVAPPAPAPQVAVVAPTPQVEEKKTTQVVKPKAAPIAPGRVSFTTRTLQIGAGQTMAALSVNRVSSTRGRARVAWTIEPGTARSGVHFEHATPQVIEFLDGQSVRSLFIPLTPEKDRANIRNSKTFTVKLQQATGGPVLGDIKQVYVTIVGDVVDVTEEKIAGVIEEGAES